MRSPLVSRTLGQQRNALLKRSTLLNQGWQAPIPWAETGKKALCAHRTTSDPDGNGSAALRAVWPGTGWDISRYLPCKELGGQQQATGSGGCEPRCCTRGELLNLPPASRLLYFNPLQVSGYQSAAVWVLKEIAVQFSPDCLKHLAGSNR